MNKLREILLAIPTTKLRVVVSILLSVFVVVATVFHTYEPAVEILAFLLVQQGLDISQYAVRKNYISETMAQEEVPIQQEQNLEEIQKE